MIARNIQQSHPANSRRGIAAAMAIIVLATMHVALIAAVTATADDAHTTALRIETVRAFYAAESGTMIVLGSGDLSALPAAGDVLQLGPSTIHWITVDPAESGNIVVEGRSGFARRRIRLTVR